MSRGAHHLFLSQPPGRRSVVRASRPTVVVSAAVGVRVVVGAVSIRGS